MQCNSSICDFILPSIFNCKIVQDDFYEQSYDVAFSLSIAILFAVL